MVLIGFYNFFAANIIRFISENEKPHEIISDSPLGNTISYFNTERGNSNAEAMID